MQDVEEDHLHLLQTHTKALFPACKMQTASTRLPVDTKFARQPHPQHPQGRACENRWLPFGEKRAHMLCMAMRSGLRQLGHSWEAAAAPDRP
jgi:hypothetical protein